MRVQRAGQTSPSPALPEAAIRFLDGTTAADDKYDQAEQMNPFTTTVLPLHEWRANKCIAWIHIGRISESPDDILCTFELDANDQVTISSNDIEILTSWEDAATLFDLPTRGPQGYPLMDIIFMQYVDFHIEIQREEAIALNEGITKVVAGAFSWLNEKPHATLTDTQRSQLTAFSLCLQKSSRISMENYPSSLETRLSTIKIIHDGTVEVVFFGTIEGTTEHTKVRRKVYIRNVSDLKPHGIHLLDPMGDMSPIYT